MMTVGGHVTNRARQVTNRFIRTIGKYVKHQRATAVDFQTSKDYAISQETAGLEKCDVDQNFLGNGPLSGNPSYVGLPWIQYNFFQDCIFTRGGDKHIAKNLQIFSVRFCEIRICGEELPNT